MSAVAAEEESADLVRYYRQRESLLGYGLLLGGTKHFGYYDPGTRLWQFTRALRRMEVELGRTLALPRDALVLDAGCGVGHVAITLATEFGLRLCGIDLLDFNVTQARHNVASRGLGDRVQLARMDYSDLAFPAESVDGICTMETLVHAGDPKGVLDGFWRTLRPGGRLVLFEYSHAPYAAMTSRAVHDYQEMNRVAVMPALDLFEHGVLESLLSATGFVSIHARDLTQQTLPMLHAFAILASAPYRLSKRYRFTERLPNAKIAVDMWRLRDFSRYEALTAEKPAD